MRELFLHVGMHKTGTTAIQATLFAHRALLQEAGYSYLDAAANHSRLVHSAFSEAPERYPPNRRAGLLAPAAAASFAAECRARLSAFLETAPGPRLVISGEGIGMLGAAGIGRMLAAMRPAVDRITVIGLVRPPRAYIASALQQRIRAGGRLERIMATLRPDYRARFEPFLEAPEVAEVRLERYVPEALVQGCSVATMLHLCGAPPALHAAMQVQRLNERMSRLGAVLHLALNEAVPTAGADGGPNPARAPGIGRFLDGLGGPPLRSLPPQAAAALDRAAEDIAWMERVLGQPFAEAEKRADAADAPDPLRGLAWPEILALAEALNALLRESAPERGAGARRLQPGGRAARQGTS